MSKEQYPQIQALIDCIKTHHLTFKVIEPRRIDPKGLYDEELKMICNDQEFIIPVDNEYQDVELNNPVMFLNMILEEIVHFEESDSFNDWLSGVHQLSKDPETIEFYERIKNYTPDIRSILGNEIEPIPHFEIEMNTGLAKALRSAKL